MIPSILKKTKTRKEYMTKLYETLCGAVYGYSGVALNELSGDSSKLLIRVLKEQMDLKRFQKLPFQSQYILDTQSDSLLKLTDVPSDASGSSLLFATQSPQTHKVQVRFRKGEKNDKDIFVEVWNDQERGFVSSRKISDKISKIYNDTIFGSVSWSKDETKVVFIGEKTETASYKNYWEDQDQAKKVEEDEKKEEEKKKEDQKEPPHYLDEKYQFMDDFGETLVGKKRPAIFVFDLVENTFKEVQGIDTSGLYPSSPIFDEHSKGMVFVGINTPLQKLGMNFCLNRDQKLFYIENPVYDKKELEGKEQYLRCLNKTEYMSVQPKFSDDFTKIAYIGAKEKFISHTGNYQLRYLNWPVQEGQESVLVVDKHPAYPKDEEDFCGLFGYNPALVSANFLGKSSRYYLVDTEFRGQGRTFIFDLDKKEQSWLNFLNYEQDKKMLGQYEMIKIYRNTVTIKYSTYNQPPQIYLINFKSTDQPTLNDLMSKDNMKATLVEQLTFNQSEEEQEISNFVQTIHKETIRLENGAEAYFLRSKDLDPSKKHPMVIIIHGGPFGSSPQDMFLQMRTYLLLQGYTVLIPNYRGSTSYGEDFLNSLLGHIGDRDIHDQGQLIKMALSKFSDIVDPSQVGVYGGSHGGFSTGWLIGHPDYKDLFKTAVLWNPVINMSYMYTSTDIPDWIYACCLNSESKTVASTEDNKTFFDMSPISVVSNVKTPSLIIIGGSDKRVPPHQGYQYYHVLKDMGVKTKLYNYPEDGHSVSSNEPSVDATLNIFFWLDEHLSS